MPNISPATVTITSTIGPGITNTAQVFNSVVDFEVNFVNNVVKITHAGGLAVSYYDYSAITTFTWVISAGLTTLTIS